MSNITDLDAEQVLKGVYEESADALRTVIDSSQLPLPVSGSLSVVNNPLDVIYSTTISASGIESVTGSFTQVVASLSADVLKIAAYDTTGYAIQLAVGPGAGESVKIRLGPGVDSPVDCQYSAGDRVSIRFNEDVSPTAGYVIINLLG